MRGVVLLMSLLLLQGVWSAPLQRGEKGDKIKQDIEEIKEQLHKILDTLRDKIKEVGKERELDENFEVDPPAGEGVDPDFEQELPEESIDPGFELDLPEEGVDEGFEIGLPDGEEIWDGETEENVDPGFNMPLEDQEPEQLENDIEEPVENREEVPQQMQEEIGLPDGMTVWDEQAEDNSERDEFPEDLPEEGAPPPAEVQLPAGIELWEDEDDQDYIPGPPPPAIDEPVFDAVEVKRGLDEGLQKFLSQLPAADKALLEKYKSKLELLKDAIKYEQEHPAQPEDEVTEPEAAPSKRGKVADAIKDELKEVKEQLHKLFDAISKKIDKLKEAAKDKEGEKEDDKDGDKEEDKEGDKEEDKEKEKERRGVDEALEKFKAKLPAADQALLEKYKSKLQLLKDAIKHEQEHPAQPEDEVAQPEPATSKRA